MPYYGSTHADWKELCNKQIAKKCKHDEIVRAWKAGQLTWDEYGRQEKKYRT